MRPTETEAWPAPVRGWWSSGNLATAPKDAAEVLDNFFPTTQTVRVRRGCTEYADLGAAVVQLLPYAGGGSEDLLAATASSVFDADRLNAAGSNAFAEWEGQSSGDWSAAQMSTTGGDFMVAVNGADHAWFWDGSEANPITAVTPNDLPFDAMSAAFSVGETVTGGTSGATAEILGISRTSAAEGTLKVGTISGTFQDNETITDGAGGSATANIPSGTSAASSVSITGIPTASLSQVWAHNERLFLIEKSSLSAWYLPVKQIGGAATELPLYGVFKLGGYLLFGASWSVDAGDGMDDMCVFVTDQGEVAVYQGTDPASASTWARVGVYRVGKPVNKHGFIQVGGDLMLVTQDGIISLRDVLSKDRAGVQSAAITFPIEADWIDAFGRDGTFPVSVTLWPRETMLFCGVAPLAGGTKFAFVANSRTGAWGRYTGWDVQCSAVSADNLYFGSEDGGVYRAEVGGSDNGASYTATCVPKFSAAGPQRKFLTRAHFIARAPVRPKVRMMGLGDYKIPDLTGPAAPTFSLTSALWGSGTWGTFIWGSRTEKNTFEQWQKVNGKGFAVSMAVMATSLSDTPSDVELVAMRLRYERGSIL